MESEMNELVREQLRRSAATMQQVAQTNDLQTTLRRAAETTALAMIGSGKLLVAGNGGSAADAQHLVGEFVCRLTTDRPPMRAVALTTDSSILTAVGNDYGFRHIFERQVEALGRPGDVFLGISTSGKSENILRALAKAQSMGMKNIGLCGSYTESMEPFCDFLLSVPSSITQNIQECHLAMEHVFCALVERYFFGSDLQAALVPVEAAV
jgi:D-sedoheptulose 7-phosphate isomerase